MNIKTRHGYETPLESDLEDYQLGWSIDDGCLYIKDPQASGKNKVLRVLSDKALLDANQKFINQLQESLNKYSDEEISKAKDELKKLYEKKTTYVIEFGLPAESDREENIDYTVDTEFDFYTKETADDAVAAFIEKLNTSDIGNQDPDIKNSGSKIIISKADHSVAYLYMILEDEYGKEYGQLINTLEQSFPSLVLEWSEHKENTIDFKLNNEVLNSIDFSSMIVDEGHWDHGEAGAVCLTSKDDLEGAADYIEYVSPICFYAKKTCNVRPSKPEIYDAYAYGYNSLPIREETFTSISNENLSGSEFVKLWTTENINFLKQNKLNSIKIKQPISEFTKRGQFYSVFRIKHYSNGWASVPSFTSMIKCNSEYLYYINNDLNPVEFYNRKTKTWDTLCNTDYVNSTVKYDNSYYSNKSKTTSTLSATSANPSPINISNGFAKSTNNSDNPTYTATSVIKNLGDITPYKINIGSDSNTLSNNTYTTLIRASSSTKLEFYKNNKLSETKELNKDLIYTSDIKIPFTESVKMDAGYDYVILEALDLNSRAYIVPMYEDKEKTKIKNQLVDILQIIERTSFNLLFTANNRSSSNLKTIINTPTNFYLPTATFITSYTNDITKSWIDIGINPKDNYFTNGNYSAATQAKFGTYSYKLGSLFKPLNNIATIFTPDSELLYENGYGSETSSIFLNNDIYLYYNTSSTNASISGERYVYPEYPLGYYASFEKYNTNVTTISNSLFPNLVSFPQRSAMSVSNIYGFARNFDSIRIIELNGD